MKKLIFSILLVFSFANAFGVQQNQISEQEMKQLENELPVITDGNGQLCLINMMVDTTVTINSQEPIKIAEYRYKCINLSIGEHTIIAQREKNIYGEDMNTTSNVTIKDSERIFMEYSYGNYSQHQYYKNSFREIGKEKGLSAIRTIKNRVNELESQVHCDEDTYANTKYCFSPTYTFERGAYNGVSVYLGINAKTPVLGPYIIGSYKGKNWLFLNRAMDSNGKNMAYKEKKHKTKTEYKTVLVVEEFSLGKVDKDYLKSHVENGLDIKLYGDNGSTILRLPSDYIKAFLNYLDHNDL